MKMGTGFGAMKMLNVDKLYANARAIGIITILISLGAWMTDWAGLVYVCPYCRVQRTVIGLLGLLILLPQPVNWALKYAAAVFAFFGLVVASMQHFNHWKRINKGEWSLSETWYADPFILSGCAIIIIIGQILFLYSYRARSA